MMMRQPHSSMEPTTLRVAAHRVVSRLFWATLLTGLCAADIIAIRNS
jgi:hypothetical protein